MTSDDKATTKLVRAGIQRVCADLTERLASRGFEYTKTRVWTRPREYTSDFVLLERRGSTYGAPLDCGVAFEIRCGIRVLNDAFETLALNGPYSDVTRTRAGRYHLRFNAKTDSTYERCVDDLERFVVDEGEPWFEEFSDPQRLLSDDASPLRPKRRELLAAAMRGESVPENLALSRKLLGLRD